MELFAKTLTLVALVFIITLQALRIKAQRQKINKIQNFHYINYVLLEQEQKRLTDMRVWLTLVVLGIVITICS